MKKWLVTLVVVLSLTACNVPEQEAIPEQEALSAEAAKNLNFTENAERDNIVKRLEQTGKPGRISYIVLLSYTGKPIVYTTVKGKITSSGKRLTPVDRVEYRSNLNAAAFMVRKAASDEGTHGSSSKYIYFWDTNGRYWQWNTLYILSDQPIRLGEPALITELDE